MFPGMAEFSPSFRARSPVSEVRIGVYQIYFPGRENSKVMI